ncbi:hypothetical protein A6J60_005540 [Psychrobacter sp. FDAARGOS_221]|nr:hypothetical protein A6J60_005540 [Psychrobacter sp. FDAARGOS_221]
MLLSDLAVYYIKGLKVNLTFRPFFILFFITSDYLISKGLKGLTTIKAVINDSYQDKKTITPALFRLYSSYGLWI